MSSNDPIEVTAASVEQAITEALERLGADQDDVTIEVLSTPRSGVLGLGARQARIRVTRRAPEGARSGVTSPPHAPPPTPPQRAAAKSAPEQRWRTERTSVVKTEGAAAVGERGADASNARERSGDDTRKSISTEEQVREATAVLARVLELMGEKAEIETVRDGDPETAELNIKSDGSGLLIGRHGQTLDALEYLVNRMLARKLKDAPPISIDTESYRARRRDQLHRMALAKGEQAKRVHTVVTLDPMPPRDRRIIHLALKDDPLITTRSSGDSFLRSIQIVPVDERREGAGGRGRRDQKPEREQAPLGEQGGFKHGQKRIV
jgi:spoIIIJ-associated protein